MTYPFAYTTAGSVRCVVATFGSSCTSGCAYYICFLLPWQLEQWSPQSTSFSWGSGCERVLHAARDSRLVFKIKRKFVGLVEISTWDITTEYYSNVLKAGSGPQAVAFCSFSNGSSLSSYDANADTRKIHISRISTIKRTMVLFCEVANSALSRKRSCATQGYKPPPSLAGPTMYPHCKGVPTHIHGMQSRLELCRRNWSHRSEPQLDTGRPLRSL